MKKIISIAIIIFSFTSTLAYSADESNDDIGFPNVPDIPVPKDISYDNYFQIQDVVKIVFGVSDPKHQLKETLTNAAYSIKYLYPRDIKYEIEIVLYGNAVLATNIFNEEYAGYSELMEKLNKEGVVFTVCNNSLSALKQSRDDVYPYMKVVPAGILELVKKQMQGFSYIHNTK